MLTIKPLRAVQAPVALAQPLNSDVGADSDETLSLGSGLPSGRKSVVAGLNRRPRRLLGAAFDELSDAEQAQQLAVVPPQPLLVQQPTAGGQSSQGASSAHTVSSAAAAHMAVAHHTGKNTNHWGQDLEHQQAIKAASTPQIATAPTHDKTPRGTPVVTAAAPATAAASGEAARIQSLRSSAGGLDNKSEVNPPWAVGGSLKNWRVAVLAVLIVFLFFLGFSYTGHELDESPVDLGVERTLRGENTPPNEVAAPP
jgi:hypothetical protein